MAERTSQSAFAGRRGNEAAREAPADSRVREYDSLEELERLAPAWDELAVAAGQPASLSGWQLAWWRQFAPPNACLRAIATFDGDTLAGIAPYCSSGRHDQSVCTLLAARFTHRVEPLAAQGRVAELAAAIAQRLATGTPSVAQVVFDTADADDHWLHAIRDAWPAARTPWVLAESRQPAPFADLGDAGYDAWLANKSTNFRQQARRYRRRLAQEGGAVRMTRSVEQLERDVEAFVALHHARWKDRGGSTLGLDVGTMLYDAGRRLLAGGHFRLWIVELDGRPIGSQLLLAAGPNALYWNGGFDTSAARLRPALVGLLAAIEDCCERGQRRLDLGGGAHAYKLRLADGDRPIGTSVLVPRDARYLRTRARLSGRQLSDLGRRAYQRLPRERQQDLRRLLRRTRSS